MRARKHKRRLYAAALESVVIGTLIRRVMLRSLEKLIDEAATRLWRAYAEGVDNFADALRQAAQNT